MTLFEPSCALGARSGLGEMLTFESSWWTSETDIFGTTVPEGGTVA